jgi:hypothetical protein
MSLGKSMRRKNFARRKAPGGSSFIPLPPRVREFGPGRGRGRPRPRRKSGARAGTFLPLTKRGKRSRQRAYLAAYRETGQIMRAGALSGLGHQRHYDWMRADPEYRAAFARARLEIAEAAERAVFRRAPAPGSSDADLIDVLTRLRRPGYGVGPRWQPPFDKLRAGR